MGGFVLVDVCRTSTFAGMKEWCFSYERQIFPKILGNGKGYEEVGDESVFEFAPPLKPSFKDVTLEWSLLNNSGDEILKNLQKNQKGFWLTCIRNRQI